MPLTNTVILHTIQFHGLHNDTLTLLLKIAIGYVLIWEGSVHKKVYTVLLLALQTVRDLHFPLRWHNLT